MKFTLYLNVMPLEEILDPAGKATLGGLHQLGFAAVQQVRIGKRIRLVVEAESAAAARELAEAAGKQLLANPIMEKFEVELIS